MSLWGKGLRDSKGGVAYRGDVWNTWTLHSCFIHSGSLSPSSLSFWHIKLTRWRDTTDKKERRVQWARLKLVLSRALQDMCLAV